MSIGITITAFATFSLPLAKPIEHGGRIITPAGEIAQIVRNQELRYLAYLEFAYPTTHTRGNHYHKQKHEYLYVIQGRLQATFVALASGEQQQHTLVTGMLLEIPPHIAHVLLPLAYTQAIEFAAMPYDPTDTYPYAIEQ